MTDKTLEKYRREFDVAFKAYTASNGNLAVATLELCRLACAVHKALPKRARDAFWQHYKLPRYRCIPIGENAPRLIKFANHLPPTLRALRCIANLDDATIKRAIADGVIHPLTHSESVYKLMGRTGTRRGERRVKGMTVRGLSVLIELVPSQFDASKASAFLRSLIAFLKSEHETWDGVDPALVLSPDLKDALKPLVARKRAARQAAA